MNRINAIISMYSTALYNSIWTGRNGFGYEAAISDEAMENRRQLKMWIKISQAIRGWKL